MSKSTAWKQGVLDLTFLNVNFANVGDATGLRGSSAAGSFFSAAHVTAPLDGGNQSTGEATYTGYTRVAIPRDGTGFSRSGTTISNVAAVPYPICTGPADNQDLFFWSIGVASAGATTVLYWRHFGPAAKWSNALASSDVFTCFAHGLAVDDRVCFYAPDPSSGGALPGGLVVGTVYWVKTVPTADTFTISATQGGATFDITTDGVAQAGKVVKLNVTHNITPIIQIGQMQIVES